MYKAVKKVLFVATVVKTHIMEFHIPYLKMFKEKGWETAVAARNDYENPDDCAIPYCDIYYDIPFARSPIKPSNIVSYKQLKKIIDEGKYDIVHCHTPVGAMLARLAAIKARMRGTRVIYTVHGFHFFKGAPLLNWLIYFPVEWVCSFMTDTLITINQEDYAFAKKHMHAKQIKYVPGVGIDLNKFNTEPCDCSDLREKVGCGKGELLLLSVGELTPNKNHETVIRALSAMKRKDIHYVIAGQGERMEQYKQLIENLRMQDNVHLLGYCNECDRWYKAADAFIFPSFREGLSVSLMEAMASGLPCIVSKIRGNTDLIDENGGIYIEPASMNSVIHALNKILTRDLKQMGAYNCRKIVKFGINKVSILMEKIYFGK